jgi:hypothetical protein
MSKPQLNAKEILQDMRSRMDDTALMAKYSLSAQGLQGVFKKLIAAGVLKQSELDNRTTAHELTANVVWKCPACGKPQPREFEECPDCGVIIGKFKDRWQKVTVADEPDIPKVKIQDAISGHVSDRLELLFFKRHLLIISVIALLILGIVAFGYKVRSDVRKETLKLYDPMRNEIARDRKMLEMGLSIGDHREILKSFVQRLGELQLGLKGQRPDLVSVLDEAAKSLQDAEDAWKREIECDATARKYWCIDCTHEQLYDQLTRELKADSWIPEYKKLGLLTLKAWTEAIQKRQSSWLDFKSTTDKALFLMAGK